jgi:transcriptional regulator, TetR family
LLLADRVDVRIDPETFIDTAIRQALRGFRASAPSVP